MNTLRLDVDADGIALITLDAADKPMNVVSPQFIDEMIAAMSASPRMRPSKARSSLPASPRSWRGRISIRSRYRRRRTDAQAGLCVRSEALVQMHRRLKLVASHSLRPSTGWRWVADMNWAGFDHRVIVDEPKAVVGFARGDGGIVAGFRGHSAFGSYRSVWRRRRIAIGRRGVFAGRSVAVRYGRSSRASRSSCCLPHAIGY